MQQVQKDVGGPAMIVASTLWLLPLAIGALAVLLIQPLPADPTRPHVLLTWLLTPIVAVVLYKAEQHYRHLLSRRAVVFGTAFALLALLFVILLVLGAYFGNGVPQHAPGVSMDPKGLPPFIWGGVGGLLYLIAFIGWFLSNLIMVPTGLVLLGITIANWRTMPRDEKQLSSAVLIAATLIGLTWPVWDAIGIWLAD